MTSELADSLPELWKVCRLDKVATIVDSLHKTPAYSETGHPMVRVTDVQGGFLDMSKTLRVTEEVFQEFTRRYTPKRGDIVFSRVGSYGNASYVTSDIPFCLGQNTALISPIINGRFLHLFLQSPFARQQIEQAVVGSTQKTISLKNISALQIAVPPPKELEGIADTLGALDDKIEQNQRTARALERLARAIFRAWFVDFDPVKAKAAGATSFLSMPQHVFDALPTRFVDSEIGTVPEGWRVGKIGDVASERREAVQPSDVIESTPYIGLEHMPRRSIALTEWGHAGTVSSNKSRFSAGEILFGKLRPYFHKVGVAPIDGVCSTDIVVVQSSSVDWLGFVLGHVSSEEFVAYTNACSSGTKMPRTNWRDMARYDVCIPPRNVAIELSKIVRSNVSLIVSNIFESRKLAEKRDLLLPRLLSGKVCVELNEAHSESRA